ncbi:ankyrin repeat domain-containing protein [Noviherbaspirillum cavernae]|nr:ankyrin repeat domain-containing protein [Noviherbaspirillum cavernae]
MLTLLFVLPSFTHASTPAMDQELIQAAEQGDLPTVQGLLRAGRDIEARDRSGRTALLAATQHNHEAVAEALIKAGADVNAQDRQRDSAYLLAGARGYLGILRLTLAHGADLKSTNRYGGTALIPACERGHVETVRTLIAAGVKVDHVNNLGWTGLLEAIILGTRGDAQTKIVRMLLDAGANPALADKDGVTPLQHARQRGYHDIAQMLINAGAR